MLNIRKSNGISRRAFVKRSAAVVLTLGSGASVLQACATPTTVSAPTAAPAAPKPTSAAAAPTAAPTVAKRTPTGAISVVLEVLPHSMDTHAKDSYEIDVVLRGSVTEALTTRKAKAPGVDPSLAEKWEQTSPTSWRFFLRKGVKFHDGTAFNADAVVWNVEDFLRPEINAPLLRLLSRLQGAKKVDDYTVDFTTKSPDPILPLELQVLDMLSPAVAKNADQRATKVVATGPYMFVEWVEGQQQKYTAFADYWGEAPYVKDVTILPRKEPGVRVFMLKAGEAQLSALIPPSDISNVPKVEATTGFDTHLMRLNTITHPSMKDTRVRQALSYAIDRKAIVENLLDGSGEPASQLFSPITTGYDASLKPYAFDSNKAKSLLDEARKAGVPVDAEITIIGRNGRLPHDVEIREAIVQMWKDVGIKAKQTTMESGPWVEWFFTVDPTKNLGDIFEFPHGNDLGDASATFPTYLMKGGRQSVFNDDMLTKMITDADAKTGADRQKAFQEISRIVYEQVPLLPLYHVKNIFGLAQNVQYEARLDGRLYLQTLKLT